MDGDVIYLKSLKKGKPYFRNVDLTRTPGEINQEDIDLLLGKANRVRRENLHSWIGMYLDDTPIAQATYTIRWWLYCAIPRFADCKNPVQEAWKAIAPFAIKLLEFVMDIRKNQFTHEEIEYYLNIINSTMKEIQTAKENGDWFARTITSSSIQEVGEFTYTFGTLSQFMELIINGQREI